MSSSPCPSTTYFLCSSLCFLQVALATFATYVLVNLNNPNERLTAEKAFVALSLFNILRFPLTMLPFVISNIVEASVSVRRLVKFLKNPELDPANVDYSPHPPRDGEECCEKVRESGECYGRVRESGECYGRVRESEGE